MKDRSSRTVYLHVHCSFGLLVSVSGYTLVRAGSGNVSIVDSERRGCLVVADHCDVLPVGFNLLAIW